VNAAGSGSYITASYGINGVENSGSPIREYVHIRHPCGNHYGVFSVALLAHSGPWPHTQFRNHFSQTVGLLGRVISSSQGRYLNTGQHKHRINVYTQQTSMPRVGFEPTIPASVRAKTVHSSCLRERGYCDRQSLYSSLGEIS
jgi:hypothetical protein